MKTAVQVTMYLTESDKWEKVLQTLRSEGVAGASAFHAAAGFLGRNTVHTAGLVEAGGNVPVIIIFVDFEEHVSLFFRSSSNWYRTASSSGKTSPSSRATWINTF